jgi:hypothetical protein
MKAKQLLIEAGLSRKYWGRRIIAAEKNRGFSKTDRDLAYEFETCACGKLDRRIPRHFGRLGYMEYSPKDKQLFNLGINFEKAVKENKFIIAAKRLIRIENRGKKVLFSYLSSR